MLVERSRTIVREWRRPQWALARHPKSKLFRGVASQPTRLKWTWPLPKSGAMLMVRRITRKKFKILFYWKSKFRSISIQRNIEIYFEGGTDFAALTWEQKEKVIRLLFAKMNGLEREGVKKLPPIQKRPLSSKSTSTALSEVDTLHERVTMDTLDTGSTFITQTVWILIYLIFLK